MRSPASNAAPILIGARQAWGIGAVLLLAAGFIFWLGRCTDIDLVLADALYDPGVHVFAGSRDTATPPG